MKYGKHRWCKHHFITMQTSSSTTSIFADITISFSVRLRWEPFVRYGHYGYAITHYHYFFDGHYDIVDITKYDITPLRHETLLLRWHYDIIIMPLLLLDEDGIFATLMSYWQAEDIFHYAISKAGVGGAWLIVISMPLPATIIISGPHFSTFLSISAWWGFRFSCQP